MTSPEFYEATLALLAEGTVAEARIDEAVIRILTTKFRIGLFDVAGKVKTLTIEEDPSAILSETVYNCPEHQEANLDAARKTMILLKNDDFAGRPVLPISGKAVGGSVKTIAIIGPNADSVRAQFGDWSFFTHPVPHLDAIPTFRVTTMLDGIGSLAEEQGIKVLYDKGCDMLDASVHSIDIACKLAAKADVVFVAVGDTLIQTGEGHDRANLALSGAQNELVLALKKVCAKKKTPLVAILVNGKPLEFGIVADASDAILETFNSGTLGGQAAAEIIFGLVNPQGRLPISFPRTTGQLPVYYNQLPGWHDGRYFDCDASPLFAFGEGLSYTAFRYDAVALSSETSKAGETIQVNVTLTNTGSRDGTETVQVYAADQVASVVTPIRELKAFAQVHVPAGKTVTVSIPLAVDSLAIVTPEEKTVLETGEFEIQAGHDSRPESLLMTMLTIV